MPVHQTFKLSVEERNRVYCCLLECEICGSKRGEYCRGSKGKFWKSSHHYQRTPFGMYAKWKKIELLKAYVKLCNQILDSHEVIGHE